MKPVPKLEVHTAPDQEAAQLSDFLQAVKTFLKIDTSDDNELLQALIKSAVERLERECELKFITQKWNIYFDYFPFTYRDEWWDGTRELAVTELNRPLRKLELPFGPAVSIGAIKTYADDGSDTEATMPSTDYQLDTKDSYPAVALRIGAVWPTTVLRPFNGIKLEEVTVGLSATYAGLPEAIQHAVKLVVAKLYENRGDSPNAEFFAMSGFTIPNTALVLLGPYMKVRL